MKQPAILGAPPAFPEPGLRFVRPSPPPLERVLRRLAPSYERGELTNGGLVRQLEELAVPRLEARHVVAVSSCTAGLMLALRALDPGGAVVLPSFTFSATAHAVAWNGLAPRFVDCDPGSLQIDVSDARGAVQGARAVMATHVFGAPCPAADLEDLAHQHGASLVFDAAHAFGARCGGRAVGGLGDASVFSLTPTKPLIAGEGGLVATDRDDVAEAVRIGRDYGNPGDYDTRFVGLNARMSELHAAVACEALESFDDDLKRRQGFALCYRSLLSSVPGVTCQAVDPGDESTYKDLAVLIDPSVFGAGRDVVVDALRAEGIDTRCYFSPPVHRQTAYAAIPSRALPATDRAAASVICLPIYPSLHTDDIERVTEALASIQFRASELEAILGGAPARG